MEKPPNIFEGQESKESREKGANVKILLKMIRHGERTPDTLQLTDYGREVTKQRARESGMSPEDFNAVKAMGSDADPSPETKMGRSLETADIYAEEIAGDEVFETRPRNVLSYKTIISPMPFDWNEFYRSNLPENFDEFSDEEKAVASKKAQKETINYLLSLKTPEAEQFRKEAAGSFAKFIEKYMRMPEKLKSGSKVLIPAGTHGGIMEHILHEALIRRDEKGNEVLGFEDIEEIGGEFSPSESYNVIIETDGNGELKDIKITFDNLDRPQGEMHLDPKIVYELAEHYKELHKDDEEFRQRFKS